MAYFFHVLIVYNYIIVVFFKVSGIFGPPRKIEYNATVIASLVCSGVAANSCDDGGVVRGWEGADGNLTSLALS